MCYGCWEKYGSPSIVNDKTLALAAMLDEFDEWTISGNNLHGVTDDWNLDDGSIEFSNKENAKDTESSPELLALERKIIAAMRDMTLEERASAMALNDGYLKSDLFKPKE